MNAARDSDAPLRASDRARAEALDRADPLAGFRERFVLADPGVVYLDGNSLGRLPLATVERLDGVLRREWGEGLIRSWTASWIDLPRRIGELIGTELIGARPGETIVSDSTTVNLYKLCRAALDARPGRRSVIAARDAFPTDRYVLEGIARDRDLAVRWIDGHPIDGPSPEDVSAALDQDVALVWLEHVHYRSAAIADMAAITGLAHAAGALTLWDVCHSVGAVPVDLTGTGADLAVGCTYKYLNGGPGAPAFLYVRGELQDAIRQPIWGWWGRRDMFEMEPGYVPLGDIRSNLAGTPPVLSMAPIEDGVRLLAEGGIERVRAKGVQLTTYAVELFDELLAPLGFELASPREGSRRGSHVTVARRDARALCDELIERGVVPDFRQPDGIRLGMAPLTTAFQEVRRGMVMVAELARSAL